MSLTNEIKKKSNNVFRGEMRKLIAESEYKENGLEGYKEAIENLYDNMIKVESIWEQENDTKIYVTTREFGTMSFPKESTISEVEYLFNGINIGKNLPSFPKLF